MNNRTSITFIIIILLISQLCSCKGTSPSNPQIDSNQGSIETVGESEPSESESSEPKEWNPIFQDDATIEFQKQIDAIHQEYFDSGNESCWDGDYRKVTVDDRDLSFCMEDIGNADVPCMCHLRDAEVLVFIKENVGELFLEDSEAGDTLYKIKGSDSIFYLISIDENEIYKVWTFERYCAR